MGVPPFKENPHGSYGKKHLILVGGVFPPIWKNMQPSNFWTIFPKFQGWKIKRNLKPPYRKHTWTNMAGWKITILNRRFTSSHSWLEFSSQSCYMLVFFFSGGVIRPWETNAFHKQQKDGLIAPARCRISPTHHIATSWLKQPFWKILPTLKLTDIAPENGPKPKRIGLYLNHQFSSAIWKFQGGYCSQIGSSPQRIQHRKCFDTT